MKFQFEIKDTFLPTGSECFTLLYKASPTSGNVECSIFTTNNCQMKVFAGIENFLEYSYYWGTDRKDFIVKHLKSIFPITDKKLLLFDISQAWCNTLLKYIGEGCVVLNAPFTSTNESERTILIINLTKL